jgi:magnesium-protoporphyrin IX monomethyl ester (oxidative) cyclase
MPFSSIEAPSLALTQIRSVIQSQFPGEISVEIAPLNHDFAKYVGIELYQYITVSGQALYSGLGDWFFRQQAFPDLPDNTEQYIQRYFWDKSEISRQIKDLIIEKRPKLGVYLDELIMKYELDGSQIVGFTSMFMQNAASFAMAGKLKRRNPEMITVIGGSEL